MKNKLYSAIQNKMFRICVLLSFALIFFNIDANAQHNFYEDDNLAGVALEGYSPDLNGGGSRTCTLSIPANSVLRRKYLIAGRHGNAANLTVTLNGTPLTFNSSNQITTFQSSQYGGTSGVHVIEVPDCIVFDVPATLVLPTSSPPYYYACLSITINNVSYDVISPNPGFTSLNACLQEIANVVNGIGTGFSASVPPVNQLQVCAPSLSTVSFTILTSDGTFGTPVIVNNYSQTFVITNTYTITMPSQSGPSNRYSGCALFIAYDHPTIPSVLSTQLYLNNQNLAPQVNYSMTFANPIGTSQPIALALITDYICNCSNNMDGSTVKVDNTNITTNNNKIGSPSPNFGTCGGPLGSFNYNNGTLTALNGNNNNQAMDCTDVLSNLVNVLSNGATTFTLKLTTDVGGNYTNAFWGAVVVYKN